MEFSSGPAHKYCSTYGWEPAPLWARVLLLSPTWPQGPRWSASRPNSKAEVSPSVPSQSSPRNEYRAYKDNQPMSQIDSYVIQPTATLRDAMACIDKNSKGITFVVDSDLRLLGSVSDGDIRRAILSGVKLDLSIQTLLDERQKAGGHGPITAQAEDSDADLLRLMNEHEIHQIPIVDSEGS